MGANGHSWFNLTVHCVCRLIVLWGQED